jgi:hypothetical protein
MVNVRNIADMGAYVTLLEYAKTLSQTTPLNFNSLMWSLFTPPYPSTLSGTTTLKA